MSGQLLIRPSEVKTSSGRISKAEISDDGEVDLFRFAVTQANVHIIQPKGSADEVLTLFGPNYPTKWTAEKLFYC